MIALALLIVGLVAVAEGVVFVGARLANEAAANAAAVRKANRKTNRANSKEIIGLISPRIQGVTSGLTQTTADFTTYNEKALIKLTNGTAGTIVLRSFSILGILVTKIGGKGGIVWEWANYADIDKRGEMFFEVGNDYIIDTTQAASIGDYLSKELIPHDMYTLSLRGCHPYFEVGDLYTLDIEYQLPQASSQTELIDVDVEIRGVSISRDVGDIGSTTLVVRVPSGAWSKTTSTRARLLAAGLPFNNFSRNNMITVASSTYVGPAEYYCDGTADNVQIQAAIDYANALGGGVIYLTRGIFYLAAKITGYSNIKILGEGDNTILRVVVADITPILDFQNITGWMLDSFIVDGNSSSITNTATAIRGIDGSNGTAATGILKSITVKNIKVTKTGDCTIEAFQYCSNLTACKALTLEANATGNNNDSSAVGFVSCTQLTGCEAQDIDAYCAPAGGTAAESIAGFASCTFMNNCKSSSLTLTTGGSGVIAPTAAHFIACTNITNCFADNTAAEPGFYNCKSVQQCKASTATKYSSSYADSGTSNACADTANGGFNS